MSMLNRSLSNLTDHRMWQSLVEKFCRQRALLQLNLACIAFIILASSAIRVIQYSFNRSLWADEAVLSLNIINRSYLELLQPLDYDQGAPVGFLWIEKLATQILGNHEYALRLFPLLGGLGALILFYFISRKYLQIWAVPIALILLGFLGPAIYYSTEVKQYSTDVAIAIASFWIAKQTEAKNDSVIKVAILSILGATMIWLSHPAIFVLSGVVFGQFITRFLQGYSKITRTAKKLSTLTKFKQLIHRSSAKIKLNPTLLIYLSWMISFIGFYFVSIQALGENQTLKTSWQSKGAFPEAIFDLFWGLNRLDIFFYDPLGFRSQFDTLAIVSFLAGCISFYSRKKSELLVVLAPIFVVLLAAYLHEYPFRGRLVLFLIPFFILLIAEGLYRLINSRNLISKWFGFVMAILVLGHPLQRAFPLFYTPHLEEEIKPVIEYIKQHQQADDKLYVYQRGIYQFQFYASKYGYQEGDYIIGIDDLDNYDGRGVSEQERIRYQNDLDQLRGHPRVWLLFSHAWVVEENELMKSYLDQLGEQIDFFERQGAFVYLYDLSHT